LGKAAERSSAGISGSLRERGGTEEGDPRVEKELGRARGMLGRASGALSEDAEERAD